MEIRVDISKTDPCRIQVGGDIDPSFGSTLAENISELIAKGRRQFLLYFAPESFADSEVLGAFVSSFRKIWNSGGNMVVVTQNLHFLKVLYVTGLIRLLRVFETEEDSTKCSSCPYLRQIDCGRSQENAKEKICKRIFRLS